MTWLQLLFAFGLLMLIAATVGLIVDKLWPPEDRK